MSEVSVGELAVADQELARFDVLVSELVDRWRWHEPGFETLGFDRCSRVLAFMAGEVEPWLDRAGLVAALAVAVERLAAK